AAKRESIDALLEAARLKDEGRCRAVVGVGCLVQRHKEELAEALPEVDLFLGAAEMDRLLPELEARGLLDPDMVPAPHPGVRLFTTGLPHVRYLKISEGCDHGCAFCAIPLMRGKHRSFPLDEVVREAQLLELQGAREINLVAQDLAHFGRDRRDGHGLPELLEAVLGATSIPWVRLLYVYSAGITPKLLDLMARERRIVPYLDIPIQHGSDAVLARMRRPERAATIRACVARLRDAVPDVAVRTTCIVGFPGETDDDFEQLCDLLEDVRFDRVGAFTYSEQEGTRAAALADDVPAALKLERLDRLTDVQRAIGAERAERYVGRTVPAIVDRAAGEDGRAEARLWWQADDIDGITYLEGDAVPGAIIECVVDAVESDDDFAGRVAGVTMPAPSPLGGRGRALPVVSGVARGSYGR
ncbi:MAG: MiaB/RimO family radical SAM methylthiotransferase, partial [Gemmatimonadaceae bacterium]